MRRPVYRFRKCTAVLWPSSLYLETIFDDGYICADFLVEEIDYGERAAEAGYTGAGAAWRWMSEKNLIHTWLSEGFGRPWSPTLRSLAGEGDYLGVPKEYQEHERAMVGKFQAYLNDVGPEPENDPWLIPTDIEVHWPALRLGALGLLRGDICPD